MIDPDLVAFADQRTAQASDFLNRMIDSVRPDVADKGVEDAVQVQGMSAVLDKTVTSPGAMADLLAIAIRRLAS